jgi:hypothetical protein
MFPPHGQPREGQRQRFSQKRFPEDRDRPGAILLSLGIPTPGIYDYDNCATSRGEQTYFFWLNGQTRHDRQKRPLCVDRGFAGQNLPVNGPPPGQAYDTQATAKQKPTRKMFHAFRLEDGPPCATLGPPPRVRAIISYKSSQSKKAEIFLFY